MTTDTRPGLFGIKNTNRNLSEKKNWGKNQFNNAFPVALANYMFSKNLEPVYLKLDNNFQVEHNNISVKDLFGVAPTEENLFFSFESIHSSYQRYLLGDVPRADLTTMLLEDGGTQNLGALEIKLTAVPDNTTYTLDERNYSAELVIRPDTIVYLGASISKAYHDKSLELFDILKPIGEGISDWTEISDVLPYIDEMIITLDKLLLNNLNNQTPLIMQPIWKTEGKSHRLAHNCLDIFIWSDFAFTRLFIDSSRGASRKTGISRQARSVIWLYKMLYDFSKNGNFDHKKIIDSLTYNTKNDKAFSITGIGTHRYLSGPELTKPRITINEIQNIILGGGEKFLSPERRFDSVIVQAPGLFDVEGE